MLKHPKKNLLLLSYEYPFGQGETFLENEVPVLAREFSSLTILPCRAFYSPDWFSGLQLGHRELPENCTLLLPDSKEGHRLNLNHLIYFLTKAGYRGINLKSVRYVTRELMRDALKATYLMPPIKKIFSQYQNLPVTAYTYWKGPATAALCYAKKQGLLTSCATRCHGGDLYYDILPFPYRPFDKFLAAKCDLVMPVSQSGADHLLAHGFSKDQLLVARLGVEKHQNISPSSTDGILRIASCSNLIPVKRIKLLCQALSHLSHPFHWVHFGDGEQRSEVEKYVENFPAQSSATLYGRIANHEVLSYYQRNPVDVFVNVSSSEGVPVSIMEALMAGIPCIASDVGGISELVDSCCGQLLASDLDHNDLAAVLDTVADDSVQWQRKRKGAYSRACQICDAEKNYQHFSQKLMEM